MGHRSHSACADAQEGGAGRYLEVDLPGGGRGQLAAPHLSDHPAAAEALWEVMSPGVKLGPLLVLERMDVRLPLGHSEASPVCLHMGAVHAPADAAMGGCPQGSQDKRSARRCAEGHRTPSHHVTCLVRMGWRHELQRDLQQPAQPIARDHSSRHHEISHFHYLLAGPFLPISPGTCAALQRIGVVKLSRKSSLLSAAGGGALPSSIEDVRESALLQGYIASLTNDAVFVRCQLSCHRTNSGRSCRGHWFNNI